ncbi:hypothetical protein LINPERPRIM_LOCUS28476 [Linum perenne]
MHLGIAHGCSLLIWGAAQLLERNSELRMKVYLLPGRRDIVEFSFNSTLKRLFPSC